WGWHQWKVKYIPVNADGTTGEMFCLFGNGPGFAGDGMPAGWNFNGMSGPTRFNLPSSCVYDNDRNFYISDQGNLRIRRVLADADDDFTTAQAFVQSHQNNIVETFANVMGVRTLPDAGYDTNSGDGGPAGACTFNVQSGFDAIPQMRLAIDRARNLLYVADSDNSRVRVIDLNAVPPTINIFAGGGAMLDGSGLLATQVQLRRPADVDVAQDGSGNVLITDTFNNCVRLVDFQTRVIRTVAGTCGSDQYGYEGDGGPATRAKLQEPGGAYLAGGANDAAYTVYVADTINHRVRRVNAVPKNP
ncbi:MAG TPA: hypothetical protein VGM03_11555, partial [Phycisphaerae bacterium]